MSDAAFVASLLEFDPSVRSRFLGRQRRSQRVALTLLATMGVLLVGGVLYLWGLPALADWAASRVPVSWEEQLGDIAIEQLAPAEARCLASQSAEAIAQITARLVAAGGPSPYQFSVIVVDSPEVNAFAVPGGKIVLLQGMLRKTETPAELAGVLAHEMEHVRRRHSVQAIFREASIRLLLSALTGSTSAESTGGLAVETLGALRYRRHDEEEADRAGMRMIQQAKIDPRGMVDLFARLHKESGDVPRALEYLSTHPATESRLERLQFLADQARYTPTPLPDSSWKQTREACQNLPRRASRAKKLPARWER